MIDFKLFQLFILGVIDHKNRNLIWINVTLNPTRAWIMQQFRNIAIEEIKFPEYLIIDNDGIFGKWIEGDLKCQFGIKVLRIARASPWQNGIIERYFGTLKRELLNRIPIVDETQIRMICFDFLKYYNHVRPHQGIGGRVPLEFLSEIPVPNINVDLNSVKYKKIKHMDGMFAGIKLVA